MCQRKFVVWKIGIILTGTLLFFVLITWTLDSTARAYPVVLGSAQSGTVAIQVTPTEDATVTALNKEKLAQEVEQLKVQNEPNLLEWLRTNATILLVVGGGIFGLLRYLAERRDSQKRFLQDRQSERDKRDEERFQSAVTELGNDKQGTRIGAAVVLRTFLKPGYERFYAQIFDLAVAHLRDPQTPLLLEDPNPAVSPLKQALTTVFKEAFPLARRPFEGSPQPVLGNVTGISSLDAAGIQLDNAYMREADLKQVWMPYASLQKADLKGAVLCEANLYKANLSETALTGANLSKANLIKTNLIKTWFRRATLCEAKLNGAKLRMVNFSEANLESVDFREADLTGTSLEKAQSLKDADLRGSKGLTKEQLEACKAKGAIVDEDPTVGSSQPP
jgi:hypothetical protein